MTPKKRLPPRAVRPKDGGCLYVDPINSSTLNLIRKGTLFSIDELKFERYYYSVAGNFESTEHERVVYFIDGMLNNYPITEVMLDGQPAEKLLQPFWTNEATLWNTLYQTVFPNLPQPYSWLNVLIHWRTKFGQINQASHWATPDLPGQDAFTAFAKRNAVHIHERDLTVLRVDIDGDASRNGGILAKYNDDEREDVLPGVVVLANVDDDDSNAVRDGFLADAGTITAPDIDDIAPLILRRLEVPDQWSVRLTLHSPANVNTDPALGTVIGTTDVLRVFSSRAVGAMPILGPMLADTLILPETAAHGVDLAKLRAQDITLGVEGLEFAGEVKLKLELINTAGLVSAMDEIQLKVAPFVLLPNTSTPSRLLLSTHDPSFQSEITTIVGSASNVIAVPYPTYNDQWTQDAWEIGFSSWPGASGQVVVMPVSFETLRFDPMISDDLQKWGRTNLLGPVPDPDNNKTGLGTRLADDDDQAAYGGNLEVTPLLAGHPRGRVVIGSNMPEIQRAYLKRQGIQTPLIELDVDWLGVGHTDEVVNFVGAPSGLPAWEVVFASPQLGWAIITDPNIADWTPLFYGNPADPVKTGTATGGTAISLVDDNASFLDGTPWKYVRIYDGTGVGQVAEVSVTDATTMTVIKVWNLPNTELTYRAIFLSVDDPASPSGLEPEDRATGQATWYVAPDGTSKYVLVPSTKKWRRHRSPGAGQEFAALMTRKELAGDSALRDRNIGTGTPLADGIQQRIDDIANVLPFVPGQIPFRHVPALYLGASNEPSRKAVAYVPGLVNFQVWGNKVLLPKPFGLRVAGDDRFEQQTDATLRVGSRTTHYIDVWDLYHRLDGEVHCGTNVIRLPDTSPTDYRKWWLNVQP